MTTRRITNCLDTTAKKECIIGMRLPWHTYWDVAWKMSCCNRRSGRECAAWWFMQMFSWLSCVCVSACWIWHFCARCWPLYRPYSWFAKILKKSWAFLVDVFLDESAHTEGTMVTRCKWKNLWHPLLYEDDDSILRAWIMSTKTRIVTNRSNDAVHWCWQLSIYLWPACSSIFEHACWSMGSTKRTSVLKQK